ATDALNPVKDKIVAKLSPIADAAGTAMSGVKSSVITKLNELQTWINTSFHPTPTGGGGSGSVINSALNFVGDLGISGISTAATYRAATRGLPLIPSLAGTAMEGITGTALGVVSGLAAPATFGLFDKGGPWGPQYTPEDIAAVQPNVASRPNTDEPFSWKRLANDVDFPDWLAGNVFGPNKAKTDVAVTSANNWVKGAAGNTGSFFSWLGNTASGGVKGTNPVGWLKGAAGNTGSFFNWLGKTGNSGLGGGLGDINSFFSGIGKTGNDALGGFFGQFLPGGKGPQQSWLSQFLPGTSSAAGSGGNKGIMNDIFGKNGALDFSRFIPKFTWPKISFSGIGQWIQSKIPKINWPKISLSGIGQWIQSKIPKLSWPSLNGIGDWVQSKIPKLNWKIPTLNDVKNFVWGKITSLNWKIPTLEDVRNFVGNKINPLNWSLPGAGDILGVIEKHIHDFVWPSG
ncbi:MAG: hypothetical protein K8E24_015135, partial [Methanobacterium paludis]|nr:hypothetical protein [Methanobacterium paludis]